MEKNFKKYIYIYIYSESCSVVSNSLWPHGLVSNLSLLQGSNPGLPHHRWILYQLSHKGSPRILEWVAYPFSSRSSRLGIEAGLLHCRQILYQLSYQEDIHIQTYINIYLWNWITLLYTWNTVNQLYFKLKSNKNIVKCFFTVIFW